MLSTPVRHIKDWYHTYPKEAMMFILASFFNSMGSAFMWPLTTLYVHTELHRSFGEAGFALMLQSLAGVLGQLVGGALFHRLGAKKIIVGSLALSALAQFCVPFSRQWLLYLAIMSLIGFLNAISLPAIQAFIGFRWKEKRRELFNVVYVGNNIGMAIGTSLAGILAIFSFTLTFLFNAISTLVFAIFFYSFMRRENNEGTDDISIGHGKLHRDESVIRLLSRYPLYLFIGLGSAFTWFATSIWGTGVAAYIDSQGMSVAAYSFLWTINGIIIFAGQPVTSWIKRTIARPMTSQMVVSAACYFIAFGFMFFFHQNYSALIIGMVIGTIGEMLLAPTIPAFLTETTGNSAPFYLGVVGGVGTCGRLFGPLLLGRMYDAGGVTPVLLLATGMAFLAMVFFLVHAALQRRETVAG